MADGRVEIHEPVSNHSIMKSSADCDRNSTSDTLNMEDTVEYRIIMAYAARRRPQKEKGTSDLPNGNSVGTDANGKAPSQPPAETDKKVTNNNKKKKKNKGWRRVVHILKCVKPQKEEEEPVPAESRCDVKDRCGDSEPVVDESVEEQDELAEVANRLTRIVDEIPFTPSDIVDDGPEDENIERLIGLILRESGDRMNEKELKDVAMAKELFWNYSFFKRLMRGVLMRMGLQSPDPQSPGPHTSPKTQIAVTCEATRRLSVLHTMPMNQLLGFGAKYVNEDFSDWAKQHGGYEAAFKDDDDDDDEEVQ